jgi:CheY-like chemotaxis protein
VPPNLAFNVIVPADVDYVCMKCLRAYRWVENPPRLTLLVPADMPGDQRTTATMPARRHRPRVLVVDDEESVRTFAERVLLDAGYEVVLASDGPRALRIIETQPPFDLLVIDILMPDMRGDELARQIRQREPDAKVLYLTGHSDHLFEDKSVLWGDEAFIEKPASITGLLESASLLLFGHLHGPGAPL